MARATKFVEIDFSNYDYLIDGKPLHTKIFKGYKAGGPMDFGVNGSSHMATSVICQPNAIKRLIGESEPDLIHGLTALYLCGFCGGYDGTPIGVEVLIKDGLVYWNDIGPSADYEDFGDHTPYEHIPNFCFARENYNQFIKHASAYEIK